LRKKWYLQSRANIITIIGYLSGLGRKIALSLGPVYHLCFLFNKCGTCNFTNTITRRHMHSPLVSRNIYLMPSRVVLMQPDIYHSQFPRSSSWSPQEEWTGNETADKQRRVVPRCWGYLSVCTLPTHGFLLTAYIYNRIATSKWKFNRTAACYSFSDCLVIAKRNITQHT